MQKSPKLLSRKCLFAQFCSQPRLRLLVQTLSRNPSSSFPNPRAIKLSNTIRPITRSVLTSNPPFHKHHKDTSPHLDNYCSQHAAHRQTSTLLSQHQDHAQVKMEEFNSQNRLHPKPQMPSPLQDPTRIPIIHLRFQQPISQSHPRLHSPSLHRLP